MISIVVPVYNAELYLAQCIESILQQTYRDFELILVDDGSKDTSGAICDDFSANDPRIRVIHQDNRGVSEARNVGIRISRGDWICFIDADDFVTKEYLELFSLDKNREADCILQGWITCSERTGPRKHCIPPGKIDVSRSIIPSYVLQRAEPWGKLFKKSIIAKNNLLYCELLDRGEDRLFFFYFLSYSRFIVTLESAGYVYRTDTENSLTKKDIRPIVCYFRAIFYDKLLKKMELISEINTIYSKRDIFELYKSALLRTLGQSNGEADFRYLMKRIRIRFRRLDLSYRSNLHNRVFYALVLHMPLCFLYNVILPTWKKLSNFRSR